MPVPNLLTLHDEKAYLNHYQKTLCRERIITHDGIRVYFKPQKFWHAFYIRNAAGKKAIFSPKRAQYMDWIRPTLGDSNADLRQGWNNDTKKVDQERRVAVVYEDFVVIVEMKLTAESKLKAEFVTAFFADESIDLILQAPVWCTATCIAMLQAKAS